MQNFKYGAGLKYGSFTWYSFSECDSFVDFLATGLTSIGAKQMDIIGICSDNRLEWAITDLCCIKKVYNFY